MRNNQGVNKIILVGYIDKTPRSHGQAGSIYRTLHFPLITSETVLKNGSEVLVDECHMIKLSGRVTEFNPGEFLKGRMVFIEGKIKTRALTDEEGIKRYKTEIWVTQYNLLS
jgi:single-strand DNA-binding protein